MAVDPEEIGEIEADIDGLRDSISDLENEFSSAAEASDDLYDAISLAADTYRNSIVSWSRFTQNIAQLNSPLASSVATFLKDLSLDSQRIGLKRMELDGLNSKLNLNRQEQDLIRLKIQQTEAELQSKLDSPIEPIVDEPAAPESGGAGSNSIADILNKILPEVVILRKIVEGSIKYDPKSGTTGRYKDTQTGQYESMEYARAAGVGFTTGEELRSQLGMSQSEARKYTTTTNTGREVKNIRALEQAALVRGERAAPTPTEPSSPSGEAIEKAEAARTSEIEKLQKKLKEQREQLTKTQKEETSLTEVIKNKTKDIKNLRVDMLSRALINLANILDKLVEPIRKMQQEFGIAAGVAAKLKLTNFSQSVGSSTAALTSLGKTAYVSSAQIEGAQQAFQSEFGGVITSGAAKNIAIQAKEMGVSDADLAKSRRVFMTQSMGNVGGAKGAEAQFVAEFEKKGLTAKDAMQAVAQNSELLARNGTRFAGSFTRALADSKKIGVELSKVNQVGDNIIDNFEGFLESQAELGAMGFNLDGGRLAQIAESGDTGALFGELRSQLATTGKDITQLRRSEQLALSSAFGMSIEEFQRMAGPTTGSGEELTDQQETNKILERAVNFAEAASPFLKIAAGALTAIQAILGGLHTRYLSVIAKNTGVGAGRSAIGGAGGAPTLGGAPGGAGGAAPSGGMLAGLGTGLTALAQGVKAFANPQVIGGLAVITGAMIGLGYALKLAAPSIEAIGVALKSAFEGIGTILVSAGEAIKNMFVGLSELSVPQMLALALTLPTLAASLGAFAVTSLVAAPGLLLLTNRMGKLAEYAPGVQLLSSSFMQLNAALAQFNNINTDKLKEVKEIAAPSVSGEIANFAATVTGVVKKVAQPEQTAKAAQMDFSPLEKKLDAVVAAIASMKVEMDGTRVGKILVSNDQRASVNATARLERI